MININQKRRELISQTKIGSQTHPKYGITYDVFTNVPEELKIDKSDVGKRVWIAGESRRTKVHLLEYKEIGEDNFPKGGFVCKFRSESTVRSYYYNQVILHPEEVKKSPEQIAYEKEVEEAKKHKYENPLTGRKCSYAYSLREGFITETGEKIELEDMKFLNESTGRMVSYEYAKQKGII